MKRNFNSLCSTSYKNQINLLGWGSLLIKIETILFVVYHLFLFVIFASARDLKGAELNFLLVCVFVFKRKNRFK